MNPREAKLSIALACTVLLFGAVTMHYYIQQREALAGAEAFSKAKDALIEKQNAVIAAADQRMKDRDSAWQKREEQFVKERAEIRTATQAVKVIERIVPATSGAIAEVKREDLPASARQNLPDAPSYSVMTQESAVEIARMAVDFQRVSSELLKEKQNNADLKTQLSGAQEARAAAEDKARQWQTAARGTVARRVVSAAKWAVVGAAVTCALKCR
jgi:hypothetical protein